jgi:hypothetical protein
MSQELCDGLSCNFWWETGEMFGDHVTKSISISRSYLGPVYLWRRHRGTGRRTWGSIIWLTGSTDDKKKRGVIREVRPRVICRDIENQGGARLRAYKVVNPRANQSIISFISIRDRTSMTYINRQHI